MAVLHALLGKAIPSDVIDLFFVLAGETQLIPWEVILTSGMGRKRRHQPQQPSLWSQCQTRLWTAKLSDPVLLALDSLYPTQIVLPGPGITGLKRVRSQQRDVTM